MRYPDRVYLKLVPNSKGPVAGPWQFSEAPWKGFNNGLTLKDRTVVDFDVIEQAREFWKRYRDLCTCIVRTPGRPGIHFHFRGETRARKFEHGDLKSGPNSYVVVPPSRTDAGTYLWISQGELLPFPEELFPAKQKEVVSKVIHDVRAYVMTIESHQGSHGSAGLVRAIARCRDAGLSESEATVLLQEWNLSPVVSPPWPIPDLTRAITRIYSKGGAPTIKHV